MMLPRKPKLDARTADYVLFFTTDDLRVVWRGMQLEDDPATLRGDITISRADLEAEIRRRVWWERFGYYLLLIGAVAAVIAAIEGAMPAAGSLPSQGGAQSASGGSMIPVLALVVAILAVFFGPLVARANTQRQIRATARETWIREFREQVAKLLSSDAALRKHATSHTTGDHEKERRLAEITDAMGPCYHGIRLLIAERGQQYADLVLKMDIFTNASTDQVASHAREFTAAATDILQRERAAIVTDQGVWREVWISLGLDANPWPAWSRRTHTG
jgi:hypothetical protein